MNGHKIGTDRWPHDLLIYHHQQDDVFAFYSQKNSKCIAM